MVLKFVLQEVQGLVFLKKSFIDNPELLVEFLNGFIFLEAYIFELADMVLMSFDIGMIIFLNTFYVFLILDLDIFYLFTLIGIPIRSEFPIVKLCLLVSFQQVLKQLDFLFIVKLFL